MTRTRRGPAPLDQLTADNIVKNLRANATSAHEGVGGKKWGLVFAEGFRPPGMTRQRYRLYLNKLVRDDLLIDVKRSHGFVFVLL